VNPFISEITAEFRALKANAEKAVAQVDERGKALGQRLR